MGKLAAAGASAGVLGTGGVATLGAHYMGAFGGGGEGPMYLATTVEDFQKSDGGLCLGKLFPEIPDSEKISSKKSQATKIESRDTKLGAGTSSKPKEDAVGCLVINWDKTKDSKQKSNFRFLLAGLRGNVGFAVYMTMDFSSSNAGSLIMTADGIGYTFDKTSGNWKTKMLDMKSGVKNKELIGSNIGTYFPKHQTNPVANKLRSNLDEWWNFLNKETNKVSESGGSNYRDMWWFDNDNKSGKAYQEDLHRWSSNLNTWWSYFFGTDKWNLRQVADDTVGYWQDWPFNKEAGTKSK